jgi:hypothetical protein
MVDWSFAQLQDIPDAGTLPKEPIVTAEAVGFRATTHRVFGPRPNVRNEVPALADLIGAQFTDVFLSALWHWYDA